MPELKGGYALIALGVDGNRIYVKGGPSGTNSINDARGLRRTPPRRRLVVLRPDRLARTHIASASAKRGS